MSQGLGRRVRVLMLGFRGFPNVQGGVEAYAENIGPILVECGCDVEIVVRSPYMPKDLNAWKGLKFTRIWAPRSSALEAVVHTFLGILYAAWTRPDVVHVQAIGPALLTPLARAFGLRVVVTHHGQDYLREKWGAVAKAILRLGECAGMRFANARIAISRTIQESVAERFGLECELIPNGLTAGPLASSREALEQFSLSPSKYVLMVARLVPEKRQDDLINAFIQARPTGWKLVLAGGADHESPFSKHIEQLAAQNPDIVATGFVTGVRLQELYSHAGLFVLPSSHEGLPIALLEALGYGVPVLASDIAANREVGLPSDNYFEVGNVEALAKQLIIHTTRSRHDGERNRIKESVQSRFSWNKSARQTARVLLAAATKP